MSNGYNLANVRISANEEAQINGKPYIDTAKAYYYSSMYTDKLNVVDGLFDETIPVFNAVPKVVNIASALAVGAELEPSYEDNEWVSLAIEHLALEQEKSFMCRDLILGKSILVEITSADLAGDEDQAETAYDEQNKEFPYNISYYPSDEYEIVSEGNRILWAKIKGLKLQMNEEGTEYEEVEVEKIYIKKEDGTAESYVLEGEEKSNEVQYEGGVLPLVEITTSYDMKQLFYSVDRHNELESFIRNILFLAGEPILAGIGLERLNGQTADTINNDRYKKLKALFTKSETAKVQMLEIQGTSADKMMDKQRQIVEAIIKDYPEYSISEVLSGSNVSEETTRIRLTEVLSRISEVKKNMEIGINKILGIIAFLDGKELGKNYVKFGEATGANIESLLNVVVLALTNGLISRRSAMYQIKDLFIGEDVDIEIAEIEKEGGTVDGDKQGSTSKTDSGADGTGV